MIWEEYECIDVISFRLSVLLDLVKDEDAVILIGLSFVEIDGCFRLFNIIRRNSNLLG